MSRTIKPGQPGAKRWINWFRKQVKDYDAVLINIRHVDDKINDRKLVYLTIQVSDEPWKQPKTFRIPPNKYIYLKVGQTERDVQEEIKKLGGVWDYQKQGWKIQYGKIRNKHFDLEERMFDP